MERRAVALARLGAEAERRALVRVDLGAGQVNLVVDLAAARGRPARASLVEAEQEKPAPVRARQALLVRLAQKVLVPPQRALIQAARPVAWRGPQVLAYPM